MAVDGRSAETPEAVAAAIGRHRSGESVSLEVQRKGERSTIDTTLKPYPMEDMQNATMQYASVEAQPGVRLRTITSVPKATSGSPFPAVFLIQGGGCSSIDTPFGPTLEDPGIIHTIGSRGFVTMRVEKSGIGDSQGAPCASIGFKEELAGYQAALNALRIHPAVDPKRIHLLGLSLGGVFAPLLAAETQVAGIAVYGTPGASTPPYPGRSDRFFDEFAPIDVAGAWAKVNTQVLVLHGEFDADPVVNHPVPETIAATVNKANPGSAQFRELKGLDHCWTRHASLAASENNCGKGEVVHDFEDAVLNFLQAN